MEPDKLQQKLQIIFIDKHFQTITKQKISYQKQKACTRLD